MNNGYTTVEIDGKQVGIKFGMPCITEMFDKEIPTDLNDPVSNILYTADLLYAGYKNNCLSKREQPSLSYEPFYDLVENSFYDDEKLVMLGEIIKVFTESKAVQAGKKAMEEQETKKKSGLETKSKPSATDNLDLDQPSTTS